jgi:hypothetical protein
MGIDIKDKLKTEDKQILSNLVLESKVLETLLQERRNILSSEIKRIMAANKIDSKIYNLHVNPTKDVWELVMKPELMAPVAHLPNIKEIIKRN